MVWGPPADEVAASVPEAAEVVAAAVSVPVLAAVSVAVEAAVSAAVLAAVSAAVLDAAVESCRFTGEAVARARTDRKPKAGPSLTISKILWSNRNECRVVYGSRRKQLKASSE